MPQLLDMLQARAKLDALEDELEEEESKFKVAAKKAAEKLFLIEDFKIHPMPMELIPCNRAYLSAEVLFTANSQKGLRYKLNLPIRTFSLNEIAMKIRNSYIISQ